uniref:Protein BZR1 homolog n=1 Tax=Arundo donax TaxID=35708 RepID=A0A0A9E0F1_ARUDO
MQGEDDNEEMGVKEEEDEDEEEEDYYLEASPVAMAVPPMVNHHRRGGRPREEKERTKLRERILAGLRQHGNYNLRVRADINEVIAALAREAGWVVFPDGTTFPSSSAAHQPQVLLVIQPVVHLGLELFLPLVVFLPSPLFFSF